MSNASSPTTGVQNTSRRRDKDGGPVSGRNSKRASVACTICRERRIRCIVPEGEKECSRCKRRNIPCVIPDDDERKRRPGSKAYTNALSERVSLLESMLSAREIQPPPPAPVMGSPSSRERSEVAAQNSTGEETLSRSRVTGPDNDHIRARMTPSNSNSERRYRGVRPTSNDQSILTKLLSTGDKIHLHEPTSRASYYGPTANCHILAKSNAAADSERTVVVTEHEKQAQDVIRALPLETHDYLVSLFWEHHNDVLFVVHKEAFDRDRHAGRMQHYSAFLHICILALGFRFADKSRSDIKQVTTENMRESTIHRDAKRVLASGLDALGGIPAITALLLLGDLEVGAGRGEVGWLYTGMALRLCVDMGLHLDDIQDSQTPDLHSIVRIATLRACFIADRFWSLFLGRPLTLPLNGPMSNPEGGVLDRSGQAGADQSAKSLSMQINEALISLMEIAGKLIDDVETQRHQQDTGDLRHHRMATRDRELRRWLSRLAPDLQSSKENLASGPYSLYLLHQQYYALLVLLHMPVARYDDFDPLSEETSALDMHFMKASRDICVRSALAMASLFRQHRQRFRGKRTFRMGMQQAGVAMTALIAAMSSSDELDFEHATQCLNTLRIALLDMAHAFQPAEQMIGVLDAAVAELNTDFSHQCNGNDATAAHIAVESLPYNNSGSGHEITHLAQPIGSKTTSFRDNCRGHRSNNQNAFSGTDIYQRPQPSHLAQLNLSTDHVQPSSSAFNAYESMDTDPNPSTAHVTIPQIPSTETPADQWEFQSIDSMMGVPGLAEGDFMDLLMAFDRERDQENGMAL